MDNIHADPISTFLVDAKEYQNLTERARLNDLQAERINILEQQNKALLERLNELELFTSERFAQDRQRIAKLEHPDREPGKTDTARVQKLIRYMIARPDHKATFETLRGVLQVTPSQLRAVIKSANDLDPGRFDVRDDEHDKRKSWLIARR